MDVTLETGECGLDAFDSRPRPIAGYFEHGNEPLKKLRELI
jgi:hypothetical protein